MLALSNYLTPLAGNAAGYKFKKCQTVNGAESETDVRLSN